MSNLLDNIWEMQQTIDMWLLLHALISLFLAFCNSVILNTLYLLNPDIPPSSTFSPYGMLLGLQFLVSTVISNDIPIVFIKF